MGEGKEFLTFGQLASLIATLSPDEQNKAAYVWPSSECPAAEKVAITGITKASDGTPVIVTGKKPS